MTYTLAYLKVVSMTRQFDVLRAVERAPMRTVRYADMKGLSSNVWRDLDALVGLGALLRLAHGVYTAPPNGRDARSWTPNLETAGLALATARHGDRNAILMGLGAARYWGAIPRAIGETVVAIPAAGYRPVDVDGGKVHFAARNVEKVEASVERVELGLGLVATREQTLFDLLMRPRQGSNSFAAEEGAQNLFPQVDPEEFAEITRSATQVNGSVRAVLAKFGVSAL